MFLRKTKKKLHRIDFIIINVGFDFKMNKSNVTINLNLIMYKT